MYAQWIRSEIQAARTGWWHCSLNLWECLTGAYGLWSSEMTEIHQHAALSCEESRMCVRCLSYVAYDQGGLMAMVCRRCFTATRTVHDSACLHVHKCERRQTLSPIVHCLNTRPVYTAGESKFFWGGITFFVGSCQRTRLKLSQIMHSRQKSDMLVRANLGSVLTPNPLRTAVFADDQPQTLRPD
jgi:hypothetical protein